jgi:hypothetical protein
MVAVAQALNVMFATLREVRKLLRKRVFPAGGACFVDNGDELVKVVGVRRSVEELEARLARIKRVQFGLMEANRPAECCVRNCPSLLQPEALVLQACVECECTCRVS